MLSSYCKQCGNLHEDQECAVNSTVIEWKYEGNVVILYGSWSHFQVGYPMMKSKQPPFFLQAEINPPLPPGVHQYKFNVDGVWKHDPNTDVIDNNFGTYNNWLEVVPRKLIQVDSSDDQEPHSDEDFKFRQNYKQDLMKVKVRTYLDWNEMFVMGSWDEWKQPIKLNRKFLGFAKKYINYAYLHLAPGSYQYKFLIAGQYVYDETLPTIDNNYSSKNNILHVNRKQQHYHPQNYDNVYFTQYQIQKKYERIHGLTMTGIGNEFYIFGGRGTGHNFKNDLHILNPRTKELRIIEDTKGPIPDPRAFHNAIKYGNKIIYYGGLNSDKIFDDYYVYNTTSKTWIQSKPKGQLPSPREKASLTLLSNYQSLIYFGGYYCSHDLEVQKIYNDLYCLDLTTMMWTHYDLDEHALKPPPRSAHSATQIKDKLYVFGGQSLPEGHYTPNFNDLWILDFSKEASWANLTPIMKGEPPSPRHGHLGSALAGHLFIYGGRGEHSNDILGDLYHFNPETLLWTKPKIHGTIPIPRCYCAADTMGNGNELWIIGGHKGNMIFNQQNQTHVYVMSFEERDDDDIFGSPKVVGRKPEFVMDIVKAITK
ncbi:unnamed protein product [Paramecium sonneborni]|uniref:AMP-activated protein kinase glycogen-binding domain-containing protein n=1 Tax=Paramecium sonneborni TaxID=65129 RepID=A0A8S1MXJ9_9CILI|nr:unnamed protein product [Paramecium sonneborni]